MNNIESVRFVMRSLVSWFYDFFDACFLRSLDDIDRGKKIYTIEIKYI